MPLRTRLLGKSDIPEPAPRRNRTPRSITTAVCLPGYFLCLLIHAGCKSPLERLAQEREQRASTQGTTDGGTNILLLFHPPSSRMLTEHSLTRRTEQWQDGAAAQSLVVSVEGTLLSRFEPADGGWVLSQQTRDLKVTHNGKPVESRLISLAQSLLLKLRVSNDGAFVRLDNPDQAQSAMERAFGSSNAESVSQFFSPMQIEERARKEWDSKYGGLFNHPLSGVDAFYRVDSFGTASGVQIGYLLERRIAGTTKTAYGEAVVLSLRCLTPDQAADASVVDSDPAVLEASVECNGQELLAREPFFPIRSTVSITASPSVTDGGTALKVTFEKQVEAVELE